MNRQQDHHVISQQQQIEISEKLQVLKHGREHRNAFEVAIGTGVRLNEQEALRWSHINFDKETMSVVSSRSGSTREIPLSNAVLTALRDQHKLTGTTDYVFGTGSPSLKGTRRALSIIAGHMKMADIGWHSLRHACAMRLLISGVSPLVVCQILGWKVRSLK